MQEVGHDLGKGGIVVDEQDAGREGHPIRGCSLMLGLGRLPVKDLR